MVAGLDAYPLASVPPLDAVRRLCSFHGHTGARLAYLQYRRVGSVAQ